MHILPSQSLSGKAYASFLDFTKLYRLVFFMVEAHNSDFLRVPMEEFHFTSISPTQKSEKRRFRSLRNSEEQYRFITENATFSLEPQNKLRVSGIQKDHA